MPSNITSKNITLDNFSCYLSYFVRNNECHVVIRNLYNSVTIHEVILDSNLPKPYMGAFQPMIDDGNGDCIGIVFIFDNSSILKYRARKVTYGRGYISFSYIIAE